MRVAPIFVWFLAVMGPAAPGQGQTLWRTTGSLNQARLQTPGTLLPDGRVLLVGSLTCNPGCVSYATAETYDPAKGTWSPTTRPQTARFNHAVALLPNGQVLVAGGYLTPGVLTGSCEIFDPAAGKWTPTGSLSTPRQFQHAVALKDGRVLVVGGLGMDGKGGLTALASAELYDAASGQWTAAGAMASPRFLNTLTLLADGRVMAAGGAVTTGGQSSTTLSSVDLYDPATNIWRAGAALRTARNSHTATLLPNGQMLVAGGFSDSGVPARSAELYDPGADQWTSTASMRAPRAGHSATLVPDGVLVAGGSGGWVTAEMYDPAGETWSPAAEFIAARTSHSATLLHDGRVLAAGGEDPDNNYLTSSELLSLDPRRAVK